MLGEMLLAVLIPGWATFDRRRTLAVVLFLAGVGVPLAAGGYLLSSGRSWVALSVDTSVLLLLVVVLALMTLSRLVAAGEVWWSHRDTATSRRDRWSPVIAVAVCLPLALGTVAVGAARQDLAPVFTGGAADAPLFDNVEPATTIAEVEPAVDDVPETTVTTQVPLFDHEFDPDPLPEPRATRPKPERPRSGVDPAVVADVRTVLLLGGDAGPGRSGLRTDTMMLFSIHEPSGRASLVSVPRDLDDMLFPPGSELERRYPYGWDDLANAIYPKVSADEGLRAAYEVGDVRPGIVALAQAIGYSMDVTIDDYVLVDMQGFLDLVDALGGVTVRVSKEIPMPGNIPGAPTQYPDTIGPGEVRMDGTMALGYARSRKGDSDFQRTRRQRELLAALATQIDLESMVANFGGIASAVGGTLRTSLTPDELAEMLAVIGGETAIVESVGLVPPLVDVYDPDYQQIAEIVGAVRVALATGTPSGY